MNFGFDFHALTWQKKFIFKLGSSLSNDANFFFSNRLAGFWIGVELFLDPNRGNCNGTWKTTKYFEANENSSVFTTANHLYIYDEEEDIEQIRQKIGIYKATVQGQSWQTVFF